MKKTQKGLFVLLISIIAVQFYYNLQNSHLAQKALQDNKILEQDNLKYLDSISRLGFEAKTRFSFSGVHLRAMPEKPEVKLGDTFAFDVFLVGQCFADSEISEPMIILDSATTGNYAQDTVLAEEWTGHIKIVPKTVGIQKVKGVYKVPKEFSPSKESMEFEFDFDYLVKEK